MKLNYEIYEIINYHKFFPKACKAASHKQIKRNLIIL